MSKDQLVDAAQELLTFLANEYPILNHTPEVLEVQRLIKAAKRQTYIRALRWLRNKCEGPLREHAERTFVPKGADGLCDSMCDYCGTLCSHCGRAK